MKFETALQTYHTILANGPLGTRLKYDHGYEASFNVMSEDKGKQILMKLYQDDIAIAQMHSLPIILNAATFRASKHHLQHAGLDEKDDLRTINTNCVNFIKTIRNSYSNLSTPIFIGAPLGPMNDAYSADVIPSIADAQRYHAEQIDILRELKVDFVNAVTHPSLDEALGISLAAASANVDYTIGFILNNKGTLLDGNTLEHAIQTIDSQTTNNQPLGYLITCTHASVIEKLMHSASKYERLIGIVLNGSNLTMQALAAMDKPACDTPEIFSSELLALKQSLNLTIIAGCCGTTTKHLEAIAAKT
tara:strand:- start:18646 stop:19560 length:915 start_codon:yes stop_codon:yes gene_type:complete